MTEDDEGRLVVGPLPAPAVERLEELDVHARVVKGLRHYLEREPQVVFRSAEESPDAGRRVTPEEVRADTLKALYRQEPRLRRAVEELDLELMD